MDVTFVLEESGVSATVEVPCDVDVAAAKEVACTALAVLPASVEMRIGTQVLEETCRLQDTAFESGVQVVLAFPCADIRCPVGIKVGDEFIFLEGLSLSRCGKLCSYICSSTKDHNVIIGVFDTETLEHLFLSQEHDSAGGPPAVSHQKRCYLPCGDHIREIALPGGEVLRKVEGNSESVFACGSVVVSQGEDGVSVYDEDLTLLRSLSHKGCEKVAVSHCGGWVITSSRAENTTRVWDVNTGVDVACVTGAGPVAVSQSASAFAVGDSGGRVHLFDLSGVGLGSVDVREDWVLSDVTMREVHIKFTPDGTYFLVNIRFWSDDEDRCRTVLQQYKVADLSRVHEYQCQGPSFVSFDISPCSSVAVMMDDDRHTIVTKRLQQ